MSNLIRSTAFMAAVMLCSAGASAQMTSVIEVHPDSIVPGSPFLIEVDSYWPDGCRGDIRVAANSAQIDVILDRSTLPEEILCPLVLTPMRALVNPRDHVDGPLQMQPSFKVRLLRRDRDGDELVELVREVQLADNASPPASAQPGSWTSSSAPKTAITIEQQGGLLGAIVAGTDADPGEWQLAAGPLNGNVFAGTLQGVEVVPCTPEDTCEGTKRVNREVGRANILIEGFNSMLVDIRHQDQTNIEPGLVQPPRYYDRFNLDVNDPATNQLIDAGHPLSLTKPQTTFPDLSGTWFVGSGDSLERIDIGDVAVEAGLADYAVAPTVNPMFSVLPVAPRIRCATGNAGVSTAMCEFQNSTDPDACGPRFRVIDAGETRVTGVNPCVSGDPMPFFMFRR